MIGVCIKFFHANYGGMLQAYATKSILEVQGRDYELIQYKKKRTLVEVIKYLPRFLNGVLINDKYETLLKKIGEKTHSGFARNNALRMAAFQRFQEEHFTKLSPIFIGYDALCSGARRYSAVITGSDQLWSPAGLPTNYYNLVFVPDETPKISYASSFGVSKIPWYQRNRTKKYLNRIQYISMRENRGAEIVKELTGRDVPVLMDPVFVFNKDEWNDLIPCEKPEWDNYIFCYFLGSNPIHRAVANELAAKTGMKIVTLRHLDRYVAEDENFGDYAPYDVDPVRFLNILRNASYVCTDSFHGTAFSIIFEKNFIVFDRYKSSSSNSKNSRIDSVCANLNLENRRYSNVSNIVDTIQQDIDYDSVKKKIAEYQRMTKDYLNKAFTN